MFIICFSVAIWNSHENNHPPCVKNLLSWSFHNKKGFNKRMIQLLFRSGHCITKLGYMKFKNPWY